MGRVEDGMTEPPRGDKGLPEDGGGAPKGTAEAREKLLEVGSGTGRGIGSAGACLGGWPLGGLIGGGPAEAAALDVREVLRCWGFGGGRGGGPEEDIACRAFLVSEIREFSQKRVDMA